MGKKTIGTILFWAGILIIIVMNGMAIWKGSTIIDLKLQYFINVGAGIMALIGWVV